MSSHELGFELLRKSVHLVSVLIVLIYKFFGKEFVLWVLLLFLVAVLFLDYLRLEQNLKIPFFHTMYREKEAGRLGGHIYFSLGAIAAISLFSQEIASAAVLMTTFGDLSAAFVGKFCGKRRIFKKVFKNEKTLEGSSAELLVNLVIGLYFLGNPFLAFLMAFFATLTETAVNKIDDNLAVPIISGFFGQLALLFLESF
ncbi:MAG: SEC59/DGK1/VTE5 family protein [Methanosarcinaceae archaeon]|nr:SEC59/DGK1/VTE5 family protein [Methanosarcinaceae archaeon]